jgi:predicted nucleic acid-binding protein
VIVLDTNVISALMRVEPEAEVAEWLDAQPSESVWTTSITVFEVRVGLELLQPSRRRQRLEAAFERLLSEDLAGRALSFDLAAAQAAATVTARLRRAGRPVEIRDAQIAGITIARRATLATGNARHFRDLGVRLVDPWSPPRRVQQ